MIIIALSKYFRETNAKCTTTTRCLYEQVTKKGMLLRPVVSMVEMPEYILAKFLDNIIKPSITGHVFT